ncbi:hypothetical protein CVT24_012722 [Panaeolus cyanescens]|uniref:Uncharacterized protein n=1 Tax=Panaeolus cyanescens TaxID=181874 RepID=A0A409W765_9AGAR|nr:hypothetical protein CVT24_012722 [Panaeolus cyanescens]
MPTTAEGKPTERKRLLKREARRKYYARNLELERTRARERARRQRLSETVEESEQRKEKHRQAAARYRAKNRIALRIASWQRRVRIKHKLQREKDEAELDALLAEYPDAEDEV